MKMNIVCLCFLGVLIFGCHDKNVPINKLSEGKIKDILQTELPFGSSLQQVVDFLNKNKINYSIRDDKREIASMIRPPMGNFVFIFPHTDYSVIFYFDEDNKLIKYEWRNVYTGL